MLDWDNARIFLAVARTGQMLGAARKLGLDHATVSRRIATLETALGVKLIERRTNGCALTATGETFLASAEKIETEMLRAQAALSGADVAISGNVRVGAPDGFGTFVLARHLSALMDEHPGLNVQLVPLPRAFSLAKREADSHDPLRSFESNRAQPRLRQRQQDQRQGPIAGHRPEHRRGNRALGLARLSSAPIWRHLTVEKVWHDDDHLLALKRRAPLLCPKTPPADPSR